jgi:hydrogenase maturation protein HypF
MLPYTPLHHLLLERVGRPLVMTSGNISDEPIAFEDHDASRRLQGIANSFLVHDRKIHIRCDDSVVRLLGSDEYPIRRSRGYAPEPIVLSSGFEHPVLATGAELKNTFCIGVAGRAMISHHIGDLENYEALRSFTDGIDHFKAVFDAEPEVIAHDLHPEYLSTKWALEQEGVPKVAIQHHHAHIASCLADNERYERVIGLALDGTGYGTDETIWGFEVLDCDLSEFSRTFHLENIPLPGGRASVTQPWRVAAVYLHKAFGDLAADLDLDFVRRNWERAGPILQMARRGLNSPQASSAGRLFDAVAALCGLRDDVSYEGQAAAMLEQVAQSSVTRTYPFEIHEDVIRATPVICAVVDDLSSGRPVSEVAGAFHASMSGLLVEVATRVREREGLNSVALSGGTWQNLLLLTRTREALLEAGFEVLVHRRVPANDGGISLGQAVIANQAVRAGSVI